MDADQLEVRTIAREGLEASGLRVRVESRLPRRIAVGSGNAVFLYGSCFHARERIRDLTLSVNGVRHPVLRHGMPRLDLFRELHPDLRPGEEVPGVDDASAEDPLGRSFRSAFWAVVPLTGPTAAPEDLRLEASARLESGAEARAILADVEALPSVQAPRAGSSPDGHGEAGGPRVAICMATFDPPIELFEQQVESIRAQTHANWVCLVSDDRSSPRSVTEMERVIGGDPRFIVSRSPERLGHYHNFERALAMVPEDAEFVALADQDDRWMPDKLEVLLGAIGEARLAYSDTRIVNRSGEVLSESYWSPRRRNNHRNFASLLLANTVTGAASLMRREVVELALPFPPRHGDPFHDHWLAIVALATGEIRYVDRPLYDYVQHASAAIGHAGANRFGPRGLGRIGRMRQALRSPRDVFAGWRAIYFYDCCRLMLFARTAELRLGDRIPRGRRRVLARVAALDQRLSCLPWLWARDQRRLIGANETMRAERGLLRGLLWRRLLQAAVRRRELPRPGFGNDASLPPSPQVSLDGRTTSEVRARSLAEKIRPVDLDVRADEPIRTNLLIPLIDLRHLFGGYLTFFNFARALVEAGRRVRIITTDRSPPLPRAWRRQLEGYEGLAGLFDLVERANGREAPVRCNPADTLIATTWWTAHIANAAVGRLNSASFLYLIQEHETLTFPRGSLAALAERTYRFPHAALFSTELLRENFRLAGRGVYAAGPESGDRRSVSFQNAITSVEPPTAAELAARGTRGLLFYARPEEHAARNMYELGVLAISRALAEGALPADWDIHGIGSVSGRHHVDLGAGAALEILPRQDQAAYAAVLPSYDVGLALMYTPHPSLVPIEMAAAGMVAVTNTCENKTAARLAEISPNIVAADPDVDGVVAGLAEAVRRAQDFDGRIAGSKVNWSRSWKEAFDPETMAAVLRLLEPA